MRVGRVTARQSRTGYTRCLQVPCPGPAARHRASPGPRHGFRVTHLARAEDRPHSPLGAPPCRRRPASPARAPATEPRVASPWARACGQASSARRPRGDSETRRAGHGAVQWPALASGPAGRDLARPGRARRPGLRHRSFVYGPERRHRCRQSPAQCAVWRGDTLPYPDLSRDIPGKVGIAKLFWDMLG